ncbi:hypothetical protein [Demequina litorisediminis]|uniref:Uncharacterized protein n=1 Tax=Demequina litorisediminis TaxID=1849022 RepID=A0ABQ6IE39_9MICO|nr:hypothetical protein [Demequina litorisediminis]GMA36020.1 hypothetical protein GCM10025876_22240 [Demequina litorisediminis]
MMSIGRRTAAVGATLAASAMLVTACSSDGDPDATPTSGGSAEAASGTIELRVATFPPGADEAAYEAFATQEAQFEEANPDIDVIGVEYEWTGPTFAVQARGRKPPRRLHRPLHRL